MLRLTLRSGRDGRFLARVVHLGSRPFVLDYGERRVIEDLVQRLTRGFTIIKADRMVHVHPEDDDIIEQLAAFYAGEGALVFLEEPTWTGRSAGSPDVSGGRSGDPGDPPSHDDLGDEDDPTDMIAWDDVPTVDEALTTVLPEHEVRPTLPAVGLASEAPVYDDPDTVEVGLLPGVPLQRR
jgi:hypothetical protein